MTAQEIEEAWASATNEEWERMNAPDPNAKVLREAGQILQTAYEMLDQATDIATEAEDVVWSMPVRDRITSLIDEMNGTRAEIRKLAAELQRGYEG